MIKIYLSGAISNKDIKEAKKEFNEAEKSLNKTLKRLERKIANVLFIDIFDIKQFEAFIYKYDFKKYLLDYFKKVRKNKNVYIERF